MQGPWLRLCNYQISLSNPSISCSQCFTIEAHNQGGMCNVFLRSAPVLAPTSCSGNFVKTGAQRICIFTRSGYAIIIIITMALSIYMGMPSFQHVSIIHEIHSQSFTICEHILTPQGGGGGGGGEQRKNSQHWCWRYVPIGPN